MATSPVKFLRVSNYPDILWVFHNGSVSPLFAASCDPTREPLYIRIQQDTRQTNGASFSQ